MSAGEWFFWILFAIFLVSIPAAQIINSGGNDENGPSLAGEPGTDLALSEDEIRFLLNNPHNFKWPQGTESEG